MHSIVEDRAQFILYTCLVHACKQFRVSLSHWDSTKKKKDKLEKLREMDKFGTTDY